MNFNNLNDLLSGLFDHVENEDAYNVWAHLDDQNGAFEGAGAAHSLERRDGECPTEEKNVSSTPEKEKEEKEEMEIGGQTTEAENQDLMRKMEEEGEPVAAVTSSELEGGGTKVKKTVRRKMLNKKQLIVLKGVYKSKQYLTPEEYKNLAANLNLSREQVKAWFTQRRYNEKGAEADGLHHCAVCHRTFKSRAGSQAHREKHSTEAEAGYTFMDFSISTQPFFTFERSIDPSINDKM